MDFIAANYNDLNTISQYIVNNLLNKYKIILLNGPVGVGKTALTKAILKTLNVQLNDVVSPSFSLVNFYQTNNKKQIYHIDLYRLNLEDNLEFIFEYLFTGDIVIIEWPDLILKDIDLTKVINVNISFLENNKRKFTIT